jgi:hypothetical protein
LALLAKFETDLNKAKTHQENLVKAKDLLGLEHVVNIPTESDKVPTDKLKPFAAAADAADADQVTTSGHSARSHYITGLKATTNSASESFTIDWELPPPKPEHLLQRFNFMGVLLGTWDTDVIFECLTCLLNLDGIECQSLVAVVEKKTHGNPDSMIKFTNFLANFLERDGLLVFSMQSYRWEWDVDHIDVVTMATCDVGDLLTGSTNQVSSIRFFISFEKWLPV